MARHGIPIAGKLTQVADVPTPVPYNKTELQFLVLMFPGTSGWVPVADDNVPGAAWNGSVYINPALAPALPTVPLVLTKKECRLRVIAGLMAANSSSNAVARARMQALRIQVDALVVDTDAKRRAKGALEAWREDADFTKQEFTTIVGDIRGATDMSAAEETAINANWPEK